MIKLSTKYGILQYPCIFKQAHCYVHVTFLNRRIKPWQVEHRVKAYVAKTYNKIIMKGCYEISVSDLQSSIYSFLLP